MHKPIRILVADDEAAQRTILEDILQGAGHSVHVAESGTDAAAVLEHTSFDLLLTDLRMPGMDGVELLKRGVRIQPELTVILMTAYATVESAVDAMKGGAYDYLQKPFTKTELLQRVARVSERVALKRENQKLRQEIGRRSVSTLLGKSPAHQRLLSQISKIAPVSADVLITGESGTGKELVARALHEQGANRHGPFVAVNCAAIPPGVAESELFGHEKGAFTDASQKRIGRFQQAHGGTLFLDEIISMPLELQAKLLRVLEERVVEPVGGGGGRPVNLRVMAASNRRVEDLVAKGEFREDLYHRINVLEIDVPALRDRREDIELLAETFRNEISDRYAIAPPLFEPSLTEFLKRYDFPGNVRELKHLIEKLVVLSDGAPLSADNLPESLKTWQPEQTKAAPETENLDPEDLLHQGEVSLPDIEERLLREAVRQAEGNLSEAARKLGISYKTLRYRVRKLGL